MPPLRLDDDGVRRARAAAQLLGAGGAGGAAPSAHDIVAATVGVQSQDPTAAALSMRARSPGLAMADVFEALAATRQLVSTWTLRGTRHWHAAEDARWLVSLLGPVFDRPSRRAEQLGIAGEPGERAVEALRDALAGGALLTRAEVKDLLAGHGVEPSGQAPVHVIRRAALEGVLCIVPGTDGPERYALLDGWVPPAAVVDPGEAPGELARRYLGAFGPATVDDFRRWCGLGARAARVAWASAGELDAVQAGERSLWALPSPRHQAAPPAPVRLLGGFDTFVLGYADRDLLVPPHRARDVNAGGGLVRPTVVSDGQIVGTWSSTGAVRLFRDLTADEREALERELADVRRFLGSEPRLRA